MISCQQHDYLEIACLYQIAVKLTLADGTVVTGTALDTRYDDHKRECILIATELGQQLISTESLNSMQAMKPNPHFDTVSFTQYC
ncbi:Rho-binding antiterminator [Vibrio sp.]|uniref:Rho-binding antiterminator n=1 Tax=Vibrio sp. TaxID=678 RepID=UPI003D1268FC